MGTTYAIPDLHGRFDLLCAAELAIADRAGDACATIVILGDFVDRGPQSAQVIERLRRGLNERSRLICVKGNHDAIMLDALRLGHEDDAKSPFANLLEEFVGPDRCA